MKKTKTKFASAEELDTLIAQYFDWIEGKYHTVQKQTKGILTDETVWEREPEPATIAGLALYLGYISRKELCMVVGSK
ncbi:terminase small subunit [Mucilaginibacter sp. BT774]|uniref:terminase small subunit n=1 Tax=Mucilaginibacter sp. BT774 TaxID=3062276 RepID=UPI002674B19F|nr:terminase small subunit [Mucilaginibacter sp. BT774]MDO3624719.1 terminase small subunit [Mucilaginibacter sp. BT774]